MEKGTFVLVIPENKPGRVAYLKGKWVGVEIVNERGRVDEWQLAQLQVITPEEADKMSAKLLK